MLSTADLTSMRAQIALSLPETCSISRNTPASDGMGGWSESWANLATGVACRLSPAGSTTEGELAARLAAESGWVITLPTGQDVTTKDRLSVGTRLFEVVGVLARSWELSRRVVATEVS